MHLHGEEHVDKRMILYEKEDVTYDIRQRLIVSHEEHRCTTVISPIKKNGETIKAGTTITLDTVVEHDHGPDLKHGEIEEDIYKQELQRAKDILEVVKLA